MGSDNQDIFVELEGDSATEFIREVEEVIEKIRTGEIHGEYFEF